MDVTFCDESDDGFGWIAAEPDWMGRSSHALVAEGGVWLVEPRAVLQLLDRHTRDSAAVSARLEVPRLVTPSELPGSPFETIPVAGIGAWRESAPGGRSRSGGRSGAR